MAGSRKLTLQILGNAKGAVGALGQTEAAGKRLGSQMGDLGKKAGLALAGIGVSAGYMASRFVSAAYESQKVMKQTEAIIKATGEAAGMTAKEVSNLATTLSNKTGIDDEQIQTSLNMLLTFKQVRNEAGKGNDVFNRAAGLMLDLGNVFGSTDSAAMQLGKALSDPVKGISALRRAGINFTESQKEQIKSLAESGKTLEAQKIILAEVESQVGGTAAASATAMDRMKVAIGNTEEALGTLLLPAVEGFANLMTSKVLPAVQSFTDSVETKGFGQTVRDMGKSIADATPAVLEQLGLFIERAVAWISDTGLPLLRDALLKAGTAFVEWIEPQILPMLSKLGDVTLAISTWIRDSDLPAVITGFVEVGGALVDWVIDSFPKLRERLQEFVQKLGTYIQESLPIIVDKARVLGDALVDWVGEAVRKLPAEIIKLAATIVEVIVTDVIPALIKVAPKIVAALLSWTGSLAVDLVAGLASAFAELLKAIPKMAGALGSAMADLAKAAGKNLTNGLISMINGLIGKINDLLEFTIPVPFAPDIKVNAPDLPKIPMLAKGGIIDQPTLSVVGERGAEAVVPLDRYDALRDAALAPTPAASGGDVYITVQAGVGDPTAIGRSIVEALQAYQRRVGTLNLKVA
jgi:hypothetical protein